MLTQQRINWLTLHHVSLALPSEFRKNKCLTSDSLLLVSKNAPSSPGKSNNCLPILSCMKTELNLNLYFRSVCRMLQYPTFPKILGKMRAISSMRLSKSRWCKVNSHEKLALSKSAECSGNFQTCDPPVIWVEVHEGTVPSEREKLISDGKKINWSLDNVLEGERGQDIKILSPAIFYFYPNFAGGENDNGKGLENRETAFVIHHCSAWVLEHCQNWRHRWTQIIETSVPNLLLTQRGKLRWQGLWIPGWTNLR